MEIRTFVIDDHALVGTALGRALGQLPGVELSGVATTVDEAVALLGRHRPDVALVDLRLGRDLSVDRMGELHDASPATRFLVLTAWATEHGLDRALAAGARGLLSKFQPLEELADAIRRAHAGELVVCPELLDVLALLAEGMPTGEIAARLCVSEHTVRNRIGTLMAKLDVHSRMEAVREGLRLGLVLPVEPDLTAI